MQRALLAEYLCNLQPLPIRVRLLRDEAFGARFGLSPRTVVTVGGIAPIDQRELFAAARRALAGEGDERVVDLDGCTLVVVADQGGILVKRAPGEGLPLEVRLEELMILSARREERGQALNQLLDRLGPTAPDLSALRSASEERELTDEEVGELLAESVNGVVGLQARAASAVKSDRAMLDDLVPDSLSYFERFCGPDPGDAEPEVYLGTVLPSYRKGLLRLDLVRGLDVCLLGALRDDLAPGLWTEQLTDDDLWNAVVACNPTRDPFSLLGALDVALSRQHDERYRTFAHEAVEKLLRDEFPRPDSIDVYELLPLLAELVLNRINTLEDGALRAPYWKRMCAWMQAGLLARLTLPTSLDLERLREWVLGNETLEGMYAKVLDLRREPMYSAAEMSRSALRGEVVGRLVTLRSRHREAGRLMPWSDEIDNAISQFAERGSPLDWARPGPLEGHRRPAEIGGRELPEDDARKVTEEFAKDPAGPLWSRLAYISQVFDLGESPLARAREATSRVSIEGEGIDQEARLGRLADGCLVAAAHRDVELARAIAAKVLEGACKARSVHEVVTILKLLLVAGAAFPDEDVWAEWLEEQLAKVASHLTGGDALRAFLEHLEELKKVVKLTLCIHARAEALASAAI